MKTLLILFISLFVFNGYAEDSITVPDLLQNISVTIKSGDGEGSGVIFTRKDSKGDVVNFVWTAAHVIESLRKEREIISNGAKKTIVEFGDAQVIKPLIENGRTVGRSQFDAEILKVSSSENGQDLAILRLRKTNLIKDTVKFYSGNIPLLGTELYSTGSLLGEVASNSLTVGILSQVGRVRSNKQIFDQVSASLGISGSSGCGVYLKGNGEYIGMIQRGATAAFILIKPIREIRDWAKAANLEWLIDPTIEMPKEEFSKIQIED